MRGYKKNEKVRVIVTCEGYDSEKKTKEKKKKKKRKERKDNGFIQ